MKRFLAWMVLCSVLFSSQVLAEKYLKKVHVVTLIPGRASANADSMVYQLSDNGEPAKHYQFWVGGDGSDTVKFEMYSANWSGAKTVWIIPGLDTNIVMWQPPGDWAPPLDSVNINCTDSTTFAQVVLFYELGRH